MIKFSENYKKRVRAPLGTLIKSKDPNFIQKIKHEVKKAKRVVLVGDEVSYRLLKESIIPNMIIIDYRVQRTPVISKIRNILNSFSEKTYEIHNTAGEISENSFNIIKKGIMSKKKVKIAVIGEEDLLTLPTILLLPSNSIVIYGQPNEGIVIVHVTKEKKNEIKKLIEEVKQCK